MADVQPDVPGHRKGAGVGPAVGKDAGFWRDAEVDEGDAAELHNNIRIL